MAKKRILLYYEQMNSKDTTDVHTTIQSLSIKQKCSKTEISQLKDGVPVEISGMEFEDSL